MNHYFPIAFLALLFLGSAFGQDTAVDVGQAVRDLGAKSFHVRKQARKTLAGLGEDAKAELEEATKHPDPEVADVALQLLAAMLPGVGRDTPERQRRLVKAYIAAGNGSHSRRLIYELLEEESCHYAIVLALLDWQKDQKQQQTIVRGLVGEHLDRMFLSGHRQLMAETGSRGFELFVSWSMRLELADAVPCIVAHAYHRGELEELREEAKGLMVAKPSEFHRWLLVELHLLAGHEDEAVALIRELGDWAQLEGLLTRTCRWGELAKELAARAEKPSGLQYLKLAAAQRLAGQHELASATLRQVMAYDAKGVGVRLVEGWAAPAAPSGGDRHPERGSGTARGSGFLVYGADSPGGKREVPAWKCLAVYGMLADAYRASINRKTGVGYDLGQYTPAGQMAWFPRAEAEAENPQERWRLTVSRVRALWDRGDDTAVPKAREILKRCQRGEKDLVDPQVLLHIARKWGVFHERLVDMLPTLLVRLEGRGEDAAGAARELALWLVPDGSGNVLYDGGHAQFWWNCLAKADPKQDLVARATALGDFLHGRLSADETERILRSALRPDGSIKERVPGLLMVARTSAWLGRQAEAEAAYSLAMRYATEAKDVALKRSVGRLAAAVFAPVGKWSEVAAGDRRMGYSGGPRVLLRRASFLAWGGDREAGRECFERCVSMTLAGDGGSLPRRAMGVKWKGMDRALSLAVSYPQGSNWYMLCDVQEKSDMLWAVRETRDYALELRLAQRVWYAQVCWPGDFDTDDVQARNADLGFAECRALAASGEFARALARAKQVCDAFPKDSDGVADTVEALDHAGAKNEADELVAHALSRQRKLLGELPNSPRRLNRLAWLCARTGRELAEGEACARKATMMEPDEPAFHDTLALLLYRKGEAKEALELAKRCVRMAPSDPHYLYQLGRWLEEQRKK